jgi:hypothetical protein
MQKKHETAIATKKRVNSCGLASKKTKRNKIKKTKRIATVSTAQLQC